MAPVIRHSSVCQQSTGQGQDFDKNFVFEGVHSKEVDRRILKVGYFLKCNLFAFSSTQYRWRQKVVSELQMRISWIELDLMCRRTAS